jgi:hypothetical protein
MGKGIVELREDPTESNRTGGYHGSGNPQHPLVRMQHGITGTSILDIHKTALRTIEQNTGLYPLQLYKLCCQHCRGFFAPEKGNRQKKEDESQNRNYRRLAVCHMDRSANAMPERSRRLRAVGALIYTYLQLTFEHRSMKIPPLGVSARLTDAGAVFIVQPKPFRAIGVRLWISLH